MDDVESDVQKRWRLEQEASMRRLAEMLRTEIPRSRGFILVVYDYGDDSGPQGSAMSFASTGERSSTIKMLRELVEKMESGG